jgi:hypothetical protein
MIKADRQRWTHGIDKLKEKKIWMWTIGIYVDLNIIRTK